ncbi:hypothetical protein [Nocardia sp. NPDC051570]|uniref:hypothetical protein n=1 Tax=Nocardia sp. NPDC051570 TaxID=3364324 RepID=UPI0037A59111
MYQPGYPVHGYPKPPRRASGLLAGWLGLGSGAVLAYEIGPSWRHARSLWFPDFLHELSFALYTTAAILLVVGGILLMRRAFAGRVMVIIGAIAMLPEQLRVMLAIRHGYSYGYSMVHFLQPGLIHCVLELLAPVIAALLAMTPATGRWIAATHAPAYGHDRLI